MTFDARQALQYSQQITKLEQRIALLEKALVVGAGGSTVTLKSGGTMKIEAAASLVIKGAMIDIGCHDRHQLTPPTQSYDHGTTSS